MKKIKFPLVAIIICVLSFLAACTSEPRVVLQDPTETPIPSQPPIPTAADIPEPTAAPQVEPSATANPLFDLSVIAYLAIEDDTRAYYFLNLDGSGRTYWENQQLAMKEPAWSPDGTRVIFTADWDGDDEIYVMRADGSDVIQLTQNSANDWGPTWSPEGDRIAFASMRDPVSGYEGPPPEIYVMNADGSGQTRLTFNETSDHSPCWSPDDEKIAFSSYHFSYERGARINSMNTDGSEETILVDLAGDDLGARWSPNGTQLVFFSQNWDVTSVYLVYADGSGVRKLSYGIEKARYPGWSPDGEWIVLVANEEAGDDLYVVSVDGSAMINFTNSPKEREASPVWLPMGYVEAGD